MESNKIKKYDGHFMELYSKWLSESFSEIKDISGIIIGEKLVENGYWSFEES